MTPKKAVLFSGGRTSGYMLHRLLKKHADFRNTFVVAFANTGKEMPQTLEFVEEVGMRWAVEIAWLEYRRIAASELRPEWFRSKRAARENRALAEAGKTTHWFRRTMFDLASRQGEPFDDLLGATDSLPNPVTRRCSTQLKIRTVMRWLFSQGVRDYEPHIGIRQDEAQRAIQIMASCDSYEQPKFPLIEMKVREEEVLAFWKEQPFDLQLQSYQGNCDLCFLKSKGKRMRMMRENPGMADWWKNWETQKQDVTEGNGSRFRLGKSYAEVEAEALLGKPIDGFEEDIACSCAERAFDKQDDTPL